MNNVSAMLNVISFNLYMLFNLSYYLFNLLCIYYLDEVVYTL